MSGQSRCSVSCGAADWRLQGVQRGRRGGGLGVGGVGDSGVVGLSSFGKARKRGKCSGRCRNRRAQDVVFSVWIDLWDRVEVGAAQRTTEPSQIVGARAALLLLGTGAAVAGACRRGERLQLRADVYQYFVTLVTDAETHVSATCVCPQLVMPSPSQSQRQGCAGVGPRAAATGWACSDKIAAGVGN